MAEKVLGLRVPTEAESLKMYQKNLFSNVLPADEAQQVVVVGDTSTGKSTTINFLLGFPINFESRKIGTRRPCVIELIKDASCEVVNYEVNFPKWKEPINRETFEDMDQVAQKVTDANDPEKKPWYFECLVKDPKMSHELVFDGDPIYVTIKHQSFQYPLRLVDLPGLTRKSKGPEEIAKKYIQPSNICVLVIGSETAENVQFPDLVDRMCNCEQVLMVQNFADDNLTRGRAEDNYDLVKEKFQEAAAKGNDNAANLLKDLRIYMTDYGNPCTPVFKERGNWKAGIDQENWVELAAEQGCQAVQEGMYNHAQKWADRVRTKHAMLFQKYNFGAGVKDILGKIIDFQFEGIDAKLIKYKARVEEMIEEASKEEEKLKELCDTLDNPPQWQNLIGKVALEVSEFLDTTIAIPEPGDGLRGDMSEVAKCRKTTKQEAAMKDDDLTDAEMTQEDTLYGSRKHWVDDKTDTQICSLLQKHAKFEYEEELACLRSWYRLLDEFTGMLAFLPMNFIPMMAKLQASKTIAQGAADKPNMLEVMVGLVCALGTTGNVGIKDMIGHFVRRLKRLARRDLKNAMIMIKQDRYKAFKQFLDLVEKNTEEEKDKLLKLVEKVILQHMDETFKRWVIGEPKLDANGRVVLDQFEQTPVILPGTGMCGMSDPTGMDQFRKGTLHWLLPFKGHYFNGQIPFKVLRIGEELWESLGIPYEWDGLFNDGKDGPPPDVEEDLLAEIANNQAMNASNLINLEMYRLCTENYDVGGNDNITVRSPEYKYSLEVIKLLKAMQGEVANFWTNKRISMLQEIQNPANIRNFVTRKLKADLKAADMFMEAQDVENWGKDLIGTEGALQAIISIFNAFDFEKDALTTKDEIDGTSTWLRKEKLTDKLPNQDKEVTWPGIPKASYDEFLAQSAGKTLTQDSTFPDSANYKLGGSAAQRRLCEEFIYVILQLAMKPVSEVELSLAKASKGKQLTESPMDIVSKLVLHRLSDDGRNGGVVFKMRFVFLYTRTVKTGLETWMENRKNHYQRIGRTQDVLQKVGDKDGADWLLSALSEFVDSTLSVTLGLLSDKFDELLPFDWTTLNGRIPLGDKALRPQHWETSYEGGGTKATLVPEEEAKSSLQELWQMPLRYQWPTLATDKYYIEMDQTIDGWKLDDATNFMAYNSLNTVDSEAAINAVMRVPDTDKPNGDVNLAGGPFHEMALRVHKSMSANAIDYCRPRIKSMMSQVYQEENLRGALQRSGDLKYKVLYGTLASEKLKELGEVSAKKKSYKDTLEIIASNKIAVGAKAELNDEALKAKNEKILKAEQEKKDELNKDLALLEQQDQDSAKSLSELQATNKEFATSLKKYVALDQLSSWSLSMQKVEISKVPQEWQEDRFFVSAFYFQQPWMGRDMDKNVQIPDKIMPYQWIVHSGEVPWSGTLEFDATKLYEEVVTNGTLSGVRLPVLNPPGEHFLAIEVKRVTMSGSKGIFGNNQKREVEVLCTVVVPLAYALRDKSAWAELEQVGAFGKMHSEQSLSASCFQMFDRTPGRDLKTYAFKFEESMGHFGMKDNDKVPKGMEVEVFVSQNKDRDSTTYSTAPLPTASAASAGSAGGYPTASTVSKPFVDGQAVMYYSAGRKQWFRTKITKVLDNGMYEIALKPGPMPVTQGGQTILKLADA